MKDSGNPLPFRLQIGEDAIVDLHERLARTRFADEPPDQSLEQHWRYGTNNRWLRELLGFWRESFDWRAEEAALNRFPSIGWTSTGSGSTSCMWPQHRANCPRVRFCCCTAGQGRCLNFSN